MSRIVKIRKMMETLHVIAAALTNEEVTEILKILYKALERMESAE